MRLSDKSINQSITISLNIAITWAQQLLQFLRNEARQFLLTGYPSSRRRLFPIGLTYRAPHLVTYSCLDLVS